MKKSNAKHVAFVVLGVVGALYTGVALAGESGDWMLRVRAVNINTANHSDAGSGGLAGALPENAIHVSDKTIPEVDVSYFFNKHVAAELVLTYPQKHNVSIESGPLAGSIGSFKHLPPTLTLQYHFAPEAQFRPYVGAGLNYTHISSVKLHSDVAPNAQLDLGRSSLRPAFQVGMDIKLAKNTYLNLDIKKAYIRADVKLNGDKVSQVKVDPILIGVGIGWKF